MTRNYGAHQQQCTMVNACIARLQVRVRTICRRTRDNRTHLSFCVTLASVPAPSCSSSTVINPSSCSQTAPSNVVQFLFTPCTVGTVTSISPVRGPSGTSITIVGTGFSTTTCVNNVLIGSSYQCSIQSATTTQIVCLIGANSLLSARTVQNVQVNQVRQGSLSNAGLIQFQFQAQITSVAPVQGASSQLFASTKQLDRDFSFFSSRLNGRWNDRRDQWRWFHSSWYPCVCWKYRIHILGNHQLHTNQHRYWCTASVLHRSSNSDHYLGGFQFCVVFIRPLHIHMGASCHTGSEFC